MTQLKITNFSVYFSVNLLSMLMGKVCSTAEFEVRICPGGGQRTIGFYYVPRRFLHILLTRVEYESEDDRINRRQAPWNFDFLN
jgi:hypothetical protein